MTTVLFRSSISRAPTITAFPDAKRSAVALELCYIIYFMLKRNVPYR